MLSCCNDGFKNNVSAKLKIFSLHLKVSCVSITKFTPPKLPDQIVALTTEHTRSPEVNFTNVFTRSFYARRSRKRKQLLDLTVVFALLGSECVKAAHKMMVKLTPTCHIQRKITSLPFSLSLSLFCSSFSVLNLCFPKGIRTYF